MTNRVQTLRSSTSGNVPAAGTRQPGELWANFPDLQMGVIDASKTAQRLVAVRYFSTLANYAVGDFVVQGGALYVANTVVTAGAFNASNWNKMVIAGDLTTLPYLQLIGGTLTGPLAGTTAAFSGTGTFGGALAVNLASTGVPALAVKNTVGLAGITLDGPSGQFKNVQGSTAGSPRWSMALGDNTSEGGSNTGSNFTLTSFADDLSSFNASFAVARISGYVYLNGPGATPTPITNGSNGHSIIYMNKAAGTTATNILGLRNGLSRWNLSLGNSTTEPGSGNTGSDFMITRYSDAGTLLDNPLTISRANATATFSGTVNSAGFFATATLQAGNAIVMNAVSVAATGPIFGRINNVQRWGIFLGNGAAESGGNVGSDFQINAYTDAGGAGPVGCIGIKRANGIVTIPAGCQASQYAGHAGTNGAYSGYFFNYEWTGSALQAWIGTTNIGNVSVSSDYRIKKDVAPLDSMWERAKALNPISYTHKEYTPPGTAPFEGEDESRPLVANDDVEHWGFIAHELQDTLIPSAATGEKDSATHLQSPNPWTIIATLAKALQEAMTRIEALEAKAA